MRQLIANWAYPNKPPISGVGAALKTMSLLFLLHFNFSSSTTARQSQKQSLDSRCVIAGKTACPSGSVGVTANNPLTHSRLRLLRVLITAGTAVDRETVTDSFCSEDEQDFCHRPDGVCGGGGGGAQPQSSRPIRDRSSFSGRGTGRLRESCERGEVGREGGGRRGEGDRQAGRQTGRERSGRGRARNHRRRHGGCCATTPRRCSSCSSCRA